MNNAQRTGLVIFLFLFILGPAAAEVTWQGELEEAEVHFINGRYEASEAVLNRLSARTAESEADAALRDGLVSLWKGRIALARDDEKSAEVLLLGAAAAGEALRNDDGFAQGPFLSKAFLLEAEARAEVMLFKGVSFIIKNGSLVQELAEETLSLDPDNPEALVIYAQGRINAPRLFGGNKREGIQILEELWNRRPGGPAGLEISVPQAYRAAISLGETLSESDPPEAARYFRAALALAPESSRARDGLNALP